MTHFERSLWRLICALIITVLIAACSNPAAPAKPCSERIWTDTATWSGWTLDAAGDTTFWTKPIPVDHVPYECEEYYRARLRRIN